MAKRDTDYEQDLSNEYIDPMREIEAAAQNAMERLQLALVPDGNEAELVNVSDMLAKAGFTSPKVPLKELSNIPFTILMFSPFMSSYEGQDVVYHCICQHPETGERFQTVIGNARGVELLKAAERANVRGGLRVCFEYVEGKGRYGKYYQMK